LLDPLQHNINVGEHFGIPEANHPVASLLDQPRPPRIFCCLLKMLAAVKLNDKSRARTCEVCDEVPDRKLPPEAKPKESSRAKPRPQLLFCVRLIAS
jgi:hypothetical protein